VYVGERRGAVRVLVGRSEGERPLGTSTRIWEDNIKIVLRDVAWAGMDWIDLAQDRDRLLGLANAVMYLRVP
jgi:hypothetical protein